MDYRDLKAPHRTLYLCIWDPLFLLLFNVYLFFRETERQSMSRGGAETEGDTESKAGSRRWAVSTESDEGLKPTNREIMTWAEIGHLTDWANQALPQETI